MALVYVHLSDIHFGQEKGGQLAVNEDVKDQLIVDAREVISGLPNKKANGVIISGDIAYAGKKEEYLNAGLWLDRLTAAVGCYRTYVQVVPGNHDIDLSSVSPGVQLIIDDIAKRGDVALDTYLDKEQDRELLYGRFSGYRTFAEGYNCSLDSEGSILAPRVIEIAPNRYIKFLGVNTALICSKNKNEEGKLLIGKRQRVIRTEPNVEIIVIAHHPLNWLQDSDDASRYLRNRARMFLSGHEHLPAHKLEQINDQTDLLSIASGATVPPQANEVYTYCYNIIEFDWDEGTNSLKVNIHPRIWNDEKKAFETDTKHYKADNCNFTLRCPIKTVESKKEATVVAMNKSDEAKSGVIENKISEPLQQNEHKMADDSEQILLLKFFRELSSRQRLEILIKLGALPAELSQAITHNTEAVALKTVFAQGKSEELRNLMNEILIPKIDT
jgi:3',5'-cyclic AMP phosphodiesterase CpdA